MSVDKTKQPNSFDDDQFPVFKGMMDDLHNNALGVIYTNTTPISGTIPFGKLVLYDNDAGTQRIYVRTAHNVCYVNLTQV